MLKFVKCNHCQNIALLVEDKGVPMSCCGETMQELVPGMSDGAAEKHVPVIKVEGNSVVVEVGSVTHPMLEEHHIAWIVLETVKNGQTGTQLQYLNHTGQPCAAFVLAEGEKVVAAYEYCNIHGLWKAEA